jgi:hypothetical protein
MLRVLSHKTSCPRPLSSIASFWRIEDQDRRVAEMRARIDLGVIDEWIARGAPANAIR